MDGEAVRKHFLSEEGEEIRLEPVVSERVQEVADYILKFDKIARNEGRNQGVMKQSPDSSKISDNERAEKKVHTWIRSDEDNWAITPVGDTPVGRAINIEEGGKTEMRIIIDDEDYRGLRGVGGRSLYDFVTERRISEAEGVPYVYNTHPKAQYKYDNTSFDGRDFQPLRWSSSFKGYKNNGVLMALESDLGEAPERLYLPEPGFEGQSDVDWQGVQDHVNELVDTFFSGDTEINHDYSLSDFKNPDNNGLSYEVQSAPADNKALKIDSYWESPLEKKSRSEVLDRLETLEDDADWVAEATIDIENPNGLDVVKTLGKRGWYVSGFTPDFGDLEDSSELSMIYFKEPVDSYLTEGSAELIEGLGIPYEVCDGQSLEEQKSVDAVIGKPESYQRFSTF
mgnify:CR=1 FL=1